MANRGREVDEDGFFVHHMIPVGYGGVVDDVFTPPLTAPINRTTACQPVNPGLPPCYHVPLPAPETYRLLLPRPHPEPSRSAPRLAAERTTFPVPRAPDLRRLSPAAKAEEPGPPLQAAGASQPMLTKKGAALVQPLTRPAATPAPSLGERFDPIYPFLLFLALELGTFYLNLDTITRYTVLWTVLVGLGTLLTLVDSRDPSRAVTSASLGWGFSFGLVFSLPLFILVSSGLSDMVSVLFPSASPAMLFQSLVFVGPLGETLFFRGTLQERRGFAAAVLGAGISGVILYWPAASTTPIYVIAAGVFTTVLAGVYSFIRSRYGLAAAYICQVTVNLMLLFVPSLLAG